MRKMSGREPGPGLGLFAVLNGDENGCRPEIVRYVMNLKDDLTVCESSDRFCLV